MNPLLDTIELESAPNPSAAIIWMHGLGADANDFVPIVKELDLRACPALRFVFPNAPSIPVTINGGYVMRAWYDILGTDIAKREDENGLRQSQLAIEQLIEREIARGIPAERIILAGFSQGCAMALQTGLRYPHKLAGFLCLSGYVPLRDVVAAERSPVNQATPVYLAHGNADTVIPLARAEQSRDLLIDLGYPVAWHEYRMAHSVCGEEIADISRWLSSVFAQPA
ncbi:MULTISPECIES: carboxylesterase [unclassified Undibacterium]|uniref:alpha/beta hydrolase n=1 Tax=unclassified Undibacterium TaxID=2630295 RepID=UPI002AC9D9F0|nr:MULTISPECIES: carboxylesterase [unclassified Undibacterium]MEB0140121.1 carboxylesterase [Undibacterium sp. CCC2.1]MEB0173902.1 carboxylesterase [Undibacterium sp. CCC1.1]MEB0175676.1 carboxylesterase [Undibacterium sp. CCC3.4]MEB0214464.1 carboxylesterase [Undibacterium sp. 5I2]WPX42861.1 carboxylesterase [Undibacterium sp. CCC3.4]